MIVWYSVISWIKVRWFMAFMTHNRYFMVNVCPVTASTFFVINAGTKSKPTSTTFTVLGLPPASFYHRFKYISLNGVPEYPTVFLLNLSVIECPLISVIQHDLMVNVRQPQLISLEFAHSLSP